MITPGAEWGRPTGAMPDLEIRGDDTALAASVVAADAPAAARLVRFRPTGSDLARAIGLSATTTDRQPLRGVELPIDAMRTSLGIAINSVVVGVAPSRLRVYHRRRPTTVVVDGHTLFDGRATTVVVANGQFVDGLDLVPRGHPGDGLLEVQVYALNPGERPPMRGRLPAGDHLPHPRIVCRSGRSIEISGLGQHRPVALDRQRRGTVEQLSVVVLPGAVRLLL